MPRYRSYLVFIFLLLLIEQLSGQQPKRYSFTHYGTSSGLAANEVWDVAQDDEGYMWIATTNGLQRFDGVRFITFRNRKNDPSSIPANFVSQLMIDKNKNLWIQAGGLYVGIFDRRNFTFHPVAIKPSQELFLYSEKNLVQDAGGNIFMTIWNVELLTYNKEKNEFSPSYNLFQLPGGWKATGFCQLPASNKYIAGTDRGIVIFNKQTNQLSYTGHNEGKEELIERMGKITGASTLIVDSKSRIWFQSWECGGSCLYCYDTKNDSFVLYRYSFQPLVNSYHELKAIMEQSNGDLWITGLNVFGHYIDKEKQFELVYNGVESEQSISYNKVYALFEDK